MVLQKGVEPGGSEFSWGKGLVAPLERGHTPTNRQILSAMYSTDAANPLAEYADVWKTDATTTHIDPKTGQIVNGTMSEWATPKVRESGAVKSAGINPLKYNPGHYADGLQDGSGDAWRASLPPNPVG